MSSSPRRAAGIAAGALAAFNLVAAVGVSRPGLTAPVRNRSVRGRTDETELQRRYDRVRYAHGRSGWWRPGRPGLRPFVICHGYGAGHNVVGTDAAPVLEAAAWLEELGQAVLLPTFGYATGAHPYGAGRREAADVRAAAHWVQERTGVAPVVWAFSAGAHAALVAGARDGGFSALIADAPFPSPARVLKTQAAAALHLPAAALAAMPFLIEAVNRSRMIDVGTLVGSGPYPVPVLVVHATGDTIVTAADVREVADITAADLLEIAGADHVQGFRAAPGAYRARVARFLAEHGL